MAVDFEQLKANIKALPEGRQLYWAEHLANLVDDAIEQQVSGGASGAWEEDTSLWEDAIRLYELAAAKVDETTLHFANELERMNDAVKEEAAKAGAVVVKAVKPAVPWLLVAIAAGVALYMFSQSRSTRAG